MAGLEIDEAKDVTDGETKDVDGFEAWPERLDGGGGGALKLALKLEDLECVESIEDRGGAASSSMGNGEGCSWAVDVVEDALGSGL